MRRREFIAALGGAAAWPLAARGQPGKLPTIGFLGQSTRSAGSEWVAAFVQRLRELSWIEGRTIAIEYRWAEQALKGRADALYVCIDPLVNTNRIRINTLALGARMPTMHGFRDYVEAGGLMSYGANFPDLFRRAADYVDRILRGANPRDLPVEQPTKFDLVVNLTTAKALGLDVPQSLLARADEVLE
jgi:hypothetical protein